MKERLTSGLWLILSGAAMMLLGIYHSAFGEKVRPVELAPETPASARDSSFNESSALTQLPEYFAHQSGWSPAQPESLPTPTYTPVMMAFGIIFVALGLVTRWYVAVVGGTVFAISVWRWIGEIRND